METKNAGDPIGESCRIDPETRLVPLYDSAGIKMYAAPDRRKMGMRVLTNFCEDQIMKPPRVLPLRPKSMDFGRRRPAAPFWGEKIASAIRPRPRTCTRDSHSRLGYRPSLSLSLLRGLSDPHLLIFPQPAIKR